MTSNSSIGAIKRRRALFAALLSLLTAGLGQLYNGRPRRALLFLLGNVVLVISLFFLTPDTPTRATLLALAVIADLLWQLTSVIDAFIYARRVGLIELQSYNRWFVYVGIWLFAATVTSVLLQGVHKRYESFNTPSVSSEPTLFAGDSFFAVGRAPLEVKRGEVILFHLPNRPTTVYIKRVVGLPGDRIQMKSGHLFINGAPVERVQLGSYEIQTNGKVQTVNEYLERTPDGQSYRTLEDYGPLKNTAEVLVPANHYFVLGDNRGNSLDSRVPNFGFVPAALVFRKPTYIYWSRDLSRIGERIE